MPKSQRPKPGPNATDSPEEVTAESTEPLSDTQTIMAALKRTEQCVLNKIDSTVTAAVGELHTKIDNLSRDLRSEISNVVEDVKKENATFVTRIGDLEEGANGYANRVVELEAKVTTLSSQVNRLVDKTEDLESRQRRGNCRLVGVAEGVGNIRPEKAIAQLLQDALSLDYTPTLDRAHRGLQPKPADGDAPRPIIIKFHYFQEKADIIRKAMGAGPIFHNGKRFYIYPDYTLSVRKRRAAFTEVRGLLRRCPDVKYGLVYPATLKITTSAGEQKSFEDPAKAKHFIEADLHPREPEGDYSRIDYFIVDDQLLPLIPRSQYHSIVLSDHGPVQMDMIFPGNIAPQRTWRLDPHLLSYGHFKTYLSDQIDLFLEINDTKDISRSVLWESLKAYIRGQAISYTAHKNKERLG
ncbi:hypothetical protein F7725_013513 [Dissostichus mawsoni]|uniref:Uncharacterized protein n=1 Tax=Dissostichus mawsoni TaxID=36200 RepID=A0A7J5Y438_DISMA|nr:hypothetical protein F7725_013513 [Dissostichus mawsoni]